MKKGDKIIWDSGFDYDLGYFVKDSKTICYDRVMINNVTGITGLCLLPVNEIISYTDKNRLRMKQKYHRELVFNG